MILQYARSSPQEMLETYVKNAHLKKYLKKSFIISDVFMKN